MAFIVDGGIRVNDEFWSLELLGTAYIQYLRTGRILAGAVLAFGW
jgi:ABC-type transporter Mla maintaining outer membrane lipid asymmetry permease subunit MlaE